MSSVGSSSTRGTPRSFLSLVATGARGRKSATAAAISSTSQASNSRSQAAASSAAVRTAIRLTPGGGSSATLAATTVTSRAAARGLLGERESHPARGAVADEAHAVDRLAGAAGRDEHASARAAGPARRAGAASSASHAASSSCRLGQAADAVLAVGGELALRPERSPSPRERRAVPGWPASPGARTCGCSSPARPLPGTRAASAAAVSRLSACPCASLAIVFALAGAIRYRSASLDQREVRDRSPLGRGVTRVGRRASGRARTRRAVPARR